MCVAAIDDYGNWQRLYPVPFKDLDGYQRFGRWDRIRYSWTKPTDDNRLESRKIDPQSVERLGSVRKLERHSFAPRAIVRDLNAAKARGLSLALIRPENVRFRYENAPEKEIQRSRRERAKIHNQLDFLSETIVSKEPCPCLFKFDYEHNGATRTGTCIDWETEATFFKWRAQYSEEDALLRMRNLFGEEYPKRGMAFAMGTHRVWNNWLLSGIIRVDHSEQDDLFSCP